MGIEIKPHKGRTPPGCFNKPGIGRLFEFVIHAIGRKNRPRDPAQRDNNRQPLGQDELQTVLLLDFHHAGPALYPITHTAHGLDHIASKLAAHPADIDFNCIAFNFRPEFIKRFFKLAF